MFGEMRRSVMRDLETASMSNLDLPFTDMCQKRRAENRRILAQPGHHDKMVQ